MIDHIDYRLEFVKNYAPCEAYNFKSLEDVVLFLKKTTDWLGADVCIDAVGAEAAATRCKRFWDESFSCKAARPPRCTGRSTA